MTLPARLIPRPDGGPVVCLRSQPDVLHLYWPRNELYSSARQFVDEFQANCLSRAIEAPRPAASASEGSST